MNHGWLWLGIWVSLMHIRTRKLLTRTLILKPNIKVITPLSPVCGCWGAAQGHDTGGRVGRSVRGPGRGDRGLSRQPQQELMVLRVRLPEQVRRLYHGKEKSSRFWNVKGFQFGRWQSTINVLIHIYSWKFEWTSKSACQHESRQVQFKMAHIFRSSNGNYARHVIWWVCWCNSCLWW